MRSFLSVATPDPQSPSGITIAPAGPGDGSDLTELAIRSKAHWGYPAEWLAEWRPLLTITEELIASAPVFVARLVARNRRRRPRELGRREGRGAPVGAVCRGG